MAESTPMSRREKLEAWRRERRLRLERSQRDEPVVLQQAPATTFVSTSASPLSSRKEKSAEVERKFQVHRNEGMETELNRLREALRLAEEQHQETKKKLEEREKCSARLEGELEGLRRAVSSWGEREDRTLQEMKVELEEARAKEYQNERRIASMEADAVRMEKELDQMKEKCDYTSKQMQEQGTKSKEKEERLRKRLDELERCLEEKQLENQKLKKSSNSSVNSVDISRHELESLQATAAAAQQELVDLVQQKKMVEADLSKWRRVADGHQAEIRVKEKEILALGLEMKQTKDMLARRESELDALKESVAQSNAGTIIRELEVRMEGYREELLKSREHCELLEKNLSEAVLEKERIIALYQVLEGELREAMDGQNAAEELVEGIRLEAAIEGEELRAEISRMDNLLEKANKEIEQLRSCAQEDHATGPGVDSNALHTIPLTPCSAESQKSASHHIESLKARLSRVLTQHQTDAQSGPTHAVKEQDEVALHLGFGAGEDKANVDHEHKYDDRSRQTQKDYAPRQALKSKSHSMTERERPRTVLGRIDNVKY